jgi:hypothetical protein
MVRWARTGVLALVAIVAWTGALRAQGDCEKQCESTGPEGACAGLKKNVDPNKFPACVARCKKDCAECQFTPPSSRVQMALTIGPLPTCEAVSVDGVAGVLTSQLQKLGISRPDVRPVCVTGTDGSGRLQVLIWPFLATTPCDRVARDETGLPADISGSAFAVFLTKDFVNILAQIGFTGASKFPPIGLQLDSLSLRFATSPTTVITEIHGHDLETTPNVDFTTTVSDQLLTRNDCHPAADPTCGCKTDVHTDVPDAQKALVIVEGILASLGAAMLPIPIGFTDILSNDLEALDRPTARQSGVGCQIWQLLPDEIALPKVVPEFALPQVVPKAATRVTPAAPSGVTAIPRRKKLVINYDGAQPTITSEALVFQAVEVALRDRQPAVQIVGPGSVTLGRTSLDVSATYEVEPNPVWARDFVELEKLTARWTADPSTVEIDDPSKRRVTITFTAPLTLRPGQRVNRQVTVQATDSEGSTARTTANIRVIRGSAKEKPPTPAPPAACKIDPSRPDCKPNPE